MNSKNKRPYDIERWCDYVRGLLDEETEAQMDQHLETAAGDRRQVAALRRVMEVAELDRLSSPPEWAVRSAKAIGSLTRGEDFHRPSLLQRLVMSLSFDSLASPALAGTRDAQPVDRQLIYTSDEYRVDLRIEPEADFQSTVVVGQLMKTGSKPAPLPQIPILALRLGQIVAQTISGPFGEFQAEGLPASGVSLCLLLEDELCLEIGLGHNGIDGNHPGESAQ